MMKYYRPRCKEELAPAVDSAEVNENPVLWQYLKCRTTFHNNGMIYPPRRNCHIVDWV